MYFLITCEGQTLLDFQCYIFHGTWSKWSDVSKKKKNCFWGSASRKFVFPDWACVKFRQQRFLEHYDEAEPPWGSWAILLFKVWTGAAFICHCILHRSVCSSLCVALFHSVFLTLWFWWPNTWMSVLLECICHHLTFFFYVFCLFILKTGSKTQRLPFWMSHVMQMKVFVPGWMLSLE